MAELVFLKLGGSLITDKLRPQTLRPGVLARLAEEIAAALRERPDLRLLIGHGSGSFGHVTARKYGTRNGVHTAEEWRGYAETGVAAAQLNRYVVDALAGAGVPVLAVQPSASALCHDGELLSLDTRPLYAALDHGLAPVVHGDVALDEVRGGTIISTEEIFNWLAPRLGPQRVILVGEVAGVLAGDPTITPDIQLDVIPELTPAHLPGLGAVLGGSHGIDVTGGMVAKVREMLTLVQQTPALETVHLITGCVPGLVQRVLTDADVAAGTRIRR